MRARFLQNYLELASNYDAVIVWRGNNDLSAHPFKASLTAESPEEVAASLINFKDHLEVLNPFINVKIVGLIPRPDVNRFLGQETNFIIYRILNYSYVSPRDIEPKDHFEGDNVHLNDCGIYHAGRLIKRVIQSVL